MFASVPSVNQRSQPDGPAAVNSAPALISEERGIAVERGRAARVDIPEQVGSRRRPIAAPQFVVEVIRGGAAGEDEQSVHGGQVEELVPEPVRYRERAAVCPIAPVQATPRPEIEDAV